MRAMRRARYHLRRAGLAIGISIDHHCHEWRALRPAMAVAGKLLAACYDEVERAWWTTPTGRRFRVLVVCRYPAPTHNERMYVCRIRADDRRPRGERWTRDEIAATAETMPVGTWWEVVFAPWDVAGDSALRRYTARGPRALLPAAAGPTVVTLAPGDGAIPERAGGIGAGGWTAGEVLGTAAAGLGLALGWAAFVLAIVEWWFPRV